MYQKSTVRARQRSIRMALATFGMAAIGGSIATGCWGLGAPGHPESGDEYTTFSGLPAGDLSSERGR